MNSNATPSGEREDQQWLDALAGKSDGAADPAISQQAASVRKALAQHQQKINDSVPEADPAGYARLLAELQRQGLLADKPASQPSGFIQDALASLSALLKKSVDPVFRLLGVSGGASMASYWGVAATVVLSIGVVIQLSMHTNETPEDAMRGGGTVLIVSDPQTRANELVAGLKAVGVTPEMTTLANGDIQLRFAVSDQAMDFLVAQRITSVPVNNMISLQVTGAK